MHRSDPSLMTIAELTAALLLAGVDPDALLARVLALIHAPPPEGAPDATP